MVTSCRGGRRSRTASRSPRDRPCSRGKLGPVTDDMLRNPTNLIPPDQRPRVILRFSDQRDLLVSGLLGDGGSIAQRPVVVDVPVERGHVVLFANNPVWRGSTIGNVRAGVQHDHAFRQPQRRQEAGREIGCRVEGAGGAACGTSARFTISPIHLMPNPDSRFRLPTGSTAPNTRSPRSGRSSRTAVSTTSTRAPVRRCSSCTARRRGRSSIGTSFARRWTTCRCIAPDHLGFGLSDRPRGASYTPEAHAARLREFVDRARTRSVCTGRARLRRTDRASAGARGARDATRHPEHLDVAVRRRQGDAESGTPRRWRVRAVDVPAHECIAQGAHAVRVCAAVAPDEDDTSPVPGSRSRILTIACSCSGHWPARSWDRRRSTASCTRESTRCVRFPTSIIWGLKDTAFRPHLLDRWRT